MYTTIIHPIRKSLCLSIEEYVLLDTIYHLSHNDKYNGWCVATKNYLGDVCDLKRSRTYEIIKTLEKKGLIQRDNKTGFLKTMDVWNEMIANKSDWIIGFSGKESQFISANLVQQKLQISTSLNPRNEPIVQESDIHSPESGHNIYIDNKNNSKLLQTPSEKVEYGNPKVNHVLLLLLTLTGREDFKESRQYQRIFGKHIASLMEKIGEAELKKRVADILSDSFKAKNCGSLKYLYGELKAVQVIDPNKRGKDESYEDFLVRTGVLPPKKTQNVERID